MSIAGKLYNRSYNTPSKLSAVSLTLLEEIGIESEDQRKRTVMALKGKKAAGIRKTLSSPSSSSSTSPVKRRRSTAKDDDALSREYGNVPLSDQPSSNKRIALETSERKGVVEYVFNEVLDENQLSGKHVVVNRAPVMTAWTTILLERLGFDRSEALSLSHCYVNYTSTMRGVSLGILPKSERDKVENSVGTNQPHFELMGVKIPVMRMKDGSYRGISKGEVVGPEKAFEYMKKSMAQTFPIVMGALTLLADSYLEASAEPNTKIDPAEPEGNQETKGSKPPISKIETLHSKAYELYVEFRPETSGEWGKKGKLEVDRILSLRVGSSSKE
ncbi:hypothetical protein IE53DRAFT_387968 [Violaceomyces palustris]|uniref:Uncharacterized protein n=1 Tax=Violaceomyces palustris TaxID=1673888 RepID=A0ACD0NVD7_9BASI|nr:hypothetical protein IE53DRAFT_387968 [Violaceomyces palustris]